MWAGKPLETPAPRLVACKQELQWLLEAPQLRKALEVTELRRSRRLPLVIAPKSRVLIFDQSGRAATPLIPPKLHLAYGNGDMLRVRMQSVP
jgi:hypothetical protein